MAATTEAAYNASMDLVRRGDAVGLLNAMRELARRDPHPLVIGRLVRGCANVAEGPEAFERVEDLLAAADAASNDPLPQLIAGVAVHYRGHHTGRTLAAKERDYRLALRYLGRTQGAFDHAARYWLYTAVSHYRLGEQAPAEAAIAKAVETDLGSDADVLYSRAELHHRTDPKAALADLRAYRALMAANKRRGGFSAPEKEAKVGEMEARLQRAFAGEPVGPDERVFDPLKTGGHALPLWLAVVAALIVGVAAGAAASRLAKRKKP